jgi:hypothetical protein
MLLPRGGGSAYRWARDERGVNLIVLKRETRERTLFFRVFFGDNGGKTLGTKRPRMVADPELGSR